MHRMEPRVAGLGEHFFGFDGLDDRRLVRPGLHVDDVDPRRFETGYDQIASLHERMSGERA